MPERTPDDLPGLPHWQSPPYVRQQQLFAVGRMFLPKWVIERLTPPNPIGEWLKADAHARWGLPRP